MLTKYIINPRIYYKGYNHALFVLSLINQL